MVIIMTTKYINLLVHLNIFLIKPKHLSDKAKEPFLLDVSVFHIVQSNQGSGQFLVSYRMLEIGKNNRAGLSLLSQYILKFLSNLINLLLIQPNQYRLAFH